MNPKRQPKMLLLQIRKEEKVRQEELSSFIQYSGLSHEQIDVLNVFDTPQFESTIIDPYDGLFVGGASGSSVLQPDDFAFIQPCIELLLYCIQKNIPVFASCYGFQLAVIALGGEIIRDEALFEMGTPPISLHESAKEDLLFHDVPNPFHAISVHQEKALQVPDNCTELAYTDICVHAFKVIDKPFWAVQFHPEVDKKILCERLGIYKHIYTKGNEHFMEVLAGVVDTPHSNDLLKKFVDRVILA
jgi:GMP synthase (glutamine-hydrolysing)